MLVEGRCGRHHLDRGRIVRVDDVLDLDCAKPLERIEKSATSSSESGHRAMPKSESFSSMSGRGSKSRFRSNRA